MAERIHAIVKASAPDLAPKTWYGMPAYAKGGKVVCFFQPPTSSRRGTRRSASTTMRTSTRAAMWPTSWALTKLTAADEKKIGELVKKAVS